jgi:hypothetical protein
MLRLVGASGARLLALGGATGLLAVGSCLKSLDESKIRDTPATGGSLGAGATDSSAGTSGSGGTDGSAGDGGTAGSAGTFGTAGSAGTTGTGGTAGSGGTAARFIPYDPARYPVTNLQGSIPTPVIITCDTAQVFRTTKNGDPSPLVAQNIAGGAGVQIYQSLAKPQRLATISSSDYVYVAAGRAGSTTAGGVWRIAKTVGDASPVGEQVTTPDPIELAVGITVGSDGFGYVSARSTAADNPVVLRFGLDAGEDAEVLHTTTTANETGGDIAQGGSCVYWISNGNIWVIPAAGGAARSDALSTAITDAVGLFADSARFYYTRSNGEVWQRVLSPAACDGSGQPESKIAEGFAGIGDVIVWDTTVAWTAKNNTLVGADGGGVFTTPVGGGDIRQIAPKEGDPEDIAQGANDIVYSTATGRIRSVPK